MNIVSSFDTCGNLYAHHNDKVYQVCIDAKNNLYLDPGDYSIITSSEVEFGYIIDIDRKKTKQDVSIMSDDEDDEYDFDPYGAVSDKFYPEEHNYMFSIPAQNHQDVKFYFCKRPYVKNISIVKRTNGDINALYDTFIYKNDKCIFRTKLIGDPPLYVISIHGNNLFFREICVLDNIKMFNFTLDGDVLCLKKL
jgi:hypothetical protein